MAVEVADDTLPATGGQAPPRAGIEVPPCLSENTVQAFVEGEAGHAQRERVDTHVDQCSLCAQLVATAARDRAPSAPGSASPPWPTAFTKGSVLAGRFSIIRFVARGGMGEVYEAFDEKISGRVALKTMLCTLGDSDVAVQQLCEEVKLARLIAHRNVCRIHDLHEHRDAQSGAPLLFLAMEFVDGKTLKDCVRNNPLPAAEAGDLAVQLLRGLGAAHEAGVLHLDFKSQNVMLRDSGRSRQALIMDFSLSRAFDTEARMHASERQLVGTPGYISPEQLECRTALGPASDIYSFGIVFYEMLTGRLPFTGQSPSAVLFQQLTVNARRPSDVVAGLPPVFDRFVLKCLDRDASLRFADTTSALESLEACLARLGTGAAPTIRARTARLAVVAGVAISAAVLLAIADAKHPAPPEPDIHSTAPSLQPKPAEPASTPAGDPVSRPEPIAEPVLPPPVASPAPPVSSSPPASKSKPRKATPRPPRLVPSKAVQHPKREAAPLGADGTAPARPDAPRWTPTNAPRRLY